jgi:hypothetical protein
MNPLIPVILKLLPNVLPKLIPMADSLVGRIGSQDRDDNRLHQLENALDVMTERFRDLERSVKRMRALLVMSVLLSVAALVTAWMR